MSYCRIYTITPVVAGGAGAATAYTSETVRGHIESIRYVKHGTIPFHDGQTMTLTGETTGTPIWAETGVNASAVRYPRAATCDTVGVASLYAAAGEPVEDKIAIAHERLKMVIASGGDNGDTGTFYVTVS